MSFHGARSGSAASAVAHAWAHQTKESWSKNNVLFDGKIIYSYGRHFPMAALLDDGLTVLVTTRSYSNTTAKHMSKMRQAISHKVILYAYHVPDWNYDTFPESIHSKNIDSWIRDVKNKLYDVSKAKQQRTKDRLMIELGPIQEEARKYIEYFQLKLTKEQRQAIFTMSMEDYLAALKKAEAAAKRKQAALIKKGKELHPVWLEAWRNFKESDLWQTVDSATVRAVEAVENEDGNRNKVRLRTIDGNVYTSKHIKMPVDVAYRYYRKYLAVVKAGGCSNDCNYMMLDFKVQEMNADHILVGCHDIPRSEIDYIAEKLGWVKEKATA